MYTLGIESSCDETSCAVLSGYRVLSNATISSLSEHKKYGGVVPEIATRAHLKNINKVLEGALEEAGVALKNIGLVAVTNRPGLIGALVVGTSFAQAMSMALSRPLVGVNHLHAHLFAPFLNSRGPKFPFIGLVVSGGHTEIYRVDDFDRIKIIGRTRDDACGEVYDKVARAFGLGYPGGPILDRRFDPELKDVFKFKCGRMGMDLSFSGIKTAVIYKKMELEKSGSLCPAVVAGLLSSFQESVVTAIVAAVADAVVATGIKRVVCGGGVVANSYLRAKLAGLPSDIKMLLSERVYSTDNAAIVAGLGFYMYNKKGVKTGINLKVEAN